MSSIEIGKPVGKNAQNREEDVYSLQIFLNYYSRNGWFEVDRELPLTGRMSDEMLWQLADFRAKYDLKEIMGLIAPNGETIKFMNKHAESVILGGSPPKIAKPFEPKPKEKPLPTSFVRTIWPVPVLRGKFSRTGKETNIVPPNIAAKFNLAKFESDVKEFGYMAFKFSFEGVGEIKTSVKDEAAAKRQAKQTFGGGTGVVPGDQKLGHKIEAAITEKLKVELESSWTANDLRKFEEGVIKGDMKKIGNEMAAAKVNLSIFKWLDAECAVSPEFPCPFSIQGKFNLPYALLLEWGGASKEDIAAAPEAKIEFAGTLHFGPSDECWKRIGKRIGREALETVAKRAGARVGQAFVKFAGRLNIALMAIEFVNYEIALFNYLVKQANERGEWMGHIMLYGRAYVLTVGDRADEIKGNTKRASTEKGRRFQEAAIHDAKLAMSRWGERTVATALIETLAPELMSSISDPLEYLKSYTGRADHIGDLFANWLEDRPQMIERQLAIVAP